jgi:hypothetical protein
LVANAVVAGVGATPARQPLQDAEQRGGEDDSKM